MIKKLILVSSLSIIIIAVAMGAYFIVGQNTLSTQVDNFGFNFSSETTNSSNLGLRLIITINSTHVESGRALLVNVTELNIRSDLNNVSAAGWNALDIGGPCATMAAPFGIEVFKGYYTLSNISSANPVDLYQPGTYNCPPSFADTRYYLYQPLSDNATLYAANYNNTNHLTVCCQATLVDDYTSATQTLRNYWDSSGNTHSLTPGVYTILARDEWGQQLLIHFEIEQP